MPITEGTQPAAKTFTGTWTSPGQTTASFTPEAGALLVALVAADGTGAGPTDTVTDSLGGSWTLLRRENTGAGTMDGVASVWCRDSPGTSLTVTVTGTGGTSTGGQLVVRTLIGAKAAASQTGATNGVEGDPTTQQVSVTAGTGNRIYGAAFNFSNSTVMTLLGNTSAINQFSDTTNGDTWEAFKSSGNTAGTATYGYSTSTSGMTCAVEILAAPSGEAFVPHSARNRGGNLRKFRRYQPKQRSWFEVESGVAVDIRSDTALGTVGLSADSTAKKVAVVTATSGLGLASSVTAKKIAPATGLTAVGLAANFVHVDIRPVTALATVGLTATSTVKKVAPAALNAAVGLAGIVTARKVAKAPTVATAGLTGLVTARKVALATARNTVGLQASFAHVEIHPITALGVLGLTSTVTEKKRLTPLVAGAVGLTGNALPKKISKSTGLGELPLVGLATVRKKQGIAARLTFGLSAWFDVPPSVPFGGILNVIDRLATSLADADRTTTRVGAGTRVTGDIAPADRRAVTLEAANRDTPSVGTGD